MSYSIKATSTSNRNAKVLIKESEIKFGITPEINNSLPSPAELFLAFFSACVLKNVERFSKFMKFTYTHAEITVSAIRPEKPPRMDDITYKLIIHSQDPKLNLELLKKNIEKHGTIYNTVNLSCNIVGEIIKQ
jgi:uncharacterized OsmC-like protein